jgi:hypothetical protein
MRYRNLLFAATIAATATIVISSPASADAASGLPSGKHAAIGLPSGKAVKFAAKGPAAAVGTLTCAVGGDIAANPPFTPTGTPGFKSQTLTLNLTLSSCSGPSTNTPSPNPTGATVVTKKMKLAGTGKGKARTAGSCSNFQEIVTQTEHLNITWTGGAAIKNTKFKAPFILGANGGGSTTGSYAGGADTGTLTLQATAASGSQFDMVCPNLQGTGGVGSLAEIDLDPTMSSIVVNGPVNTNP